MFIPKITDHIFKLVSEYIESFVILKNSHWPSVRITTTYYRIARKIA